MSISDANRKKYGCTQAAIIADKGNVMQADIMQAGEDMAETLLVMRDEVRGKYWDLHKKIGETRFDGFHEQAKACAKLGELALAMKALDKAYSAANTVRCFTD